MVRVGGVAGVGSVMAAVRGMGGGVAAIRVRRGNCVGVVNRLRDPIGVGSGLTMLRGTNMDCLIGMTGVSGLDGGVGLGHRRHLGGLHRLGRGHQAGGGCVALPMSLVRRRARVRGSSGARATRAVSRSSGTRVLLTRGVFVTCREVLRCREASRGGLAAQGLALDCAVLLRRGVVAGHG